MDAPTPPRTEPPWSYRWDRVLGRSVPRALWILGLTLATGLGSWLWWRATVETPPGFPLRYARPKGLGPVQCDYIRTEKVPRACSYGDVVLPRRSRSDFAESERPG